MPSTRKEELRSFLFFTVVMAPVIAVLLGWAFNDEVITARTLVAGLAIIVGVALMVSRSTEKEAVRRREPSLSSARG